MYAVMDRLDQLPRPALIALVVIGFIVFWPVGLALLVGVGLLVWCVLFENSTVCL